MYGMSLILPSCSGRLDQRSAWRFGSPMSWISIQYVSLQITDTVMQRIKIATVQAQYSRCREKKEDTDTNNGSSLKTENLKWSQGLSIEAFIASAFARPKRQRSWCTYCTSSESTVDQLWINCGSPSDQVAQAAGLVMSGNSKCNNAVASDSQMPFPEHWPAQEVAALSQAIVARGEGSAGKPLAKLIQTSANCTAKLSRLKDSRRLKRLCQLHQRWLLAGLLIVLCNSK